MKYRRLWPCAFLLWLGAGVAALGEDQDDDKTPVPGQASKLPSLNAEQQRAADLRIAHGVAAKAPERIDALGLFLDTTELVSDQSELTVASAVEHAAVAELARLEQLYKSGAGASARMLEAAETEKVKAEAQA